MSDMKDPGLRLFGKNIQLSSKNTKLDLRVDEAVRDCGDDHDDNSHYECTGSNDNLKEGENRGHHEKTSSEGSKDKESSRINKGSKSTTIEDAKPASNDKECSSQDSHNKDVSDQTSSTNPQCQKPLKKPDKILPCPRCNSMTTKFCYFNNYNVNQPRHFCKDCQRYWTAGGTMRNVPVGAGRRKSKSSVASQHRHLLVPSNSYEFVHENVNVNSLFFENGGNGVIPQGLSLQAPCIQGLSRAYTLNPIQLGFPVIHSDQSSMTTSSSPSSSSSRKHSRDGTMLCFGPSDCNNNSENGRVVIQKTLKVDDPIEAANSSIWNTLQIKNNQHVSTPIAKGGFFEGSQKISRNGHDKISNHTSGEASPMVLELNPAAFSRSLSFHELR